MIKRYNIQLNCWELGYYNKSQFIIVKLEKL